MKFCTFIIILSTTIFSSELFSQTTVDQLQGDYQSGQISRTQLAINMGYRIFAPERLPARYKTSDSIYGKCGLGIYSFIKSEYENMDSEHQELFKSVATRPNLPESYVSPSGFFRIHYTTSPDSEHKVPTGDENSNGINDYVEAAAEAVEYSYFVLIDSLGYNPPPSDKDKHGSEYDIYLTNQRNNLYGFAQPDGVVPDSPNRFASYIELDNDFKEERYTKGIDALRVTAIHEFFHAVHFGYIWRWSDAFFYEICSTWIEDVGYDDVNDYFFYLPAVFENFALPMNSENPVLYKYGMSIWGHYLEKRFGPDIIRSMWDKMPEMEALYAMKNVIDNETSSTFDRELTNFYAWNYFTGSRADTLNYYNEGHLYPEVTFTDTLLTDIDTLFTKNLNNLSANYILVNSFDRTTFSVNYEIFEEDIGIMNGAIVLDEPMQNGEIDYFQFNGGTLGNTNISSKSSNPTFAVIPVVTSLGTGSYQIDLDIKFSDVFEEEINTLLPAYPNPANLNEIDNINIPFVLFDPAQIELKIFSNSGRLVKSFNKANFGIGRNEIVWNCNDNKNHQVPSGIYYYIINGPTIKGMKKIAVIR